LQKSNQQLDHIQPVVTGQNQSKPNSGCHQLQYPLEHMGISEMKNKSFHLLVSLSILFAGPSTCIQADEVLGVEVSEQPV
jgi:hypothetical protein